MASTPALSVPLAINNLLTTKTIPDLHEPERSEITEYLFNRAATPLRIAVAEVAYRNHDCPSALDLFLASTMPLAAKYSKRKALDLFVNPSDWQLECFYNGAVLSIVRMFERNKPLTSAVDGFRRYLLRTLATGALRQYFDRDEYSGVTAVKNIELIPPRRTEPNPEELLITRDLLEKITHYPLLKRALTKTLECIAELGPEKGLKEYSAKECEKNNPGGPVHRQDKKPTLNMAEIAKARGISLVSIYSQVSMARQVLRIAFNGDGRLFQAH